MIIVAGAIANKLHNGGEAWVRLSWARGFRELGEDVVLLEEITSFESPEAAQYFLTVARDFGFEGKAALILEGTTRTVGLTHTEVLDALAEADLLVNISGHLSPQLRSHCRRSIFIDIDPGFTQFWHAAGNPGARLEGHDAYFTIAENIGKPDCSIPSNGIDWQPIRQPVVLADWPVQPPAPGSKRFTTVATWRCPYGRPTGTVPVEGCLRVEGSPTEFSIKLDEWRKLIELPRRVAADFEIALDIDPAEVADLKLLQANGWQLVDPRTTVGDPNSFRAYIQSSAAEFSPAQGIYAQTRSGWFSDRSVRYLAAGKPVLVQDTGFGKNLPVGKGLLAFSTLEQAVAGVEAITANYAQHAAAARDIAESHFGAHVVLANLSERLPTQQPKTSTMGVCN